MKTQIIIALIQLCTSKYPVKQNTSSATRLRALFRPKLRVHQTAYNHFSLSQPNYALKTRVSTSRCVINEHSCVLATILPTRLSPFSNKVRGIHRFAPIRL